MEVSLPSNTIIGPLKWIQSLKLHIFYENLP
jgi:hypothetical protein